MREVKVFAPASIGNIGPGFDVLGVAVSNLGDVVRAAKKRSPGVEILAIKNDGGKLNKTPAKNTVAIAAMKVMEKAGLNEGINLTIEKGVPFPSGLGSSAASAVAGGVAANYLLDEPLGEDDLLEACTEAEAAVSGGFFADNTAAALFGGAVVARRIDGKLSVVKLGVIPDAAIILAQPDFAMFTKVSRGVLPEQVPLKDFVFNMGAAVAIASGVLKKDVKLFGGSIQDRVIEPARSGLIKGFYDVKNAALDNGALGCSISGGGPTIFAVADVKAPLEKIGEAMKKAFAKNGANATIHIASMDTKGARIIR